MALTHRYNSHCLMCNLGKRSREVAEIKSLEISGQEIIEILTNPLYSQLVELDLTCGEPHLRDDLAKLATNIARLKPTYLPRLRSIIYHFERSIAGQIISNYQRILEVLRHWHRSSQPC